MEVEENQTYQGCKLPRIGNGIKKGDEQYPDDEEDGKVKRRRNGGGGGGGGVVGVGGGGGGGFDFSRLCGWPSSRIVRVSRASGGKDRHSKVLTSKGLRDRRVRLSVNTAIQFYDLQDRLGCDQPSKAVEWLLKAAASSIAELPSINTSFQDTIKQQQEEQQQQLSDEKRSTGGTEHGFDSADVEIDGSFDPNYQIQQQQQQQNGALMSKSACSSNSENSREARPDVELLRADRPDSGLSLSRSKSRIKARERARGRAAEKEKDKENETTPRVLHDHQHDQLSQNLNPLSQNASSFTELLTSGMNTTSNAGGNNNNNNNTGTNGPVHQNHSSGGGASEANFFHKSPRHWSATPMDYFATAGVLGPSSTRNATHGFSGQFHYGEHYQEMQPFSFVPDHFVPLVTVAGGNNGSNNNNNNNNNAYDLNFTISSSSSSGLDGFNRGTLQSNSSTPSLLPHLQRFPSTDGSPSAFFIGTTPPAENHHHFLTGFDARLQLCYGDGRHSDYKGKGKS